MRNEQPQQVPQDRLEKVFLSWNDVHSMLKEAHKFILGSTFMPEAIITLHKGGVIPATILSYMLNVPSLHVLKIVDNRVAYSKDIVDLHGKRVLLVENIIETGVKDYMAAEFLKNISINSLMTVTLIQKEAQQAYTKPDFAAKSISKDEWAVFPWETLNY